MKFIVDAYLPPSLCKFLGDGGHDAVHPRDLPVQNATTDTASNQLSTGQPRVLVTKDSDFFGNEAASHGPSRAR